MIRTPRQCPDYSFLFISEPSSIGSKENPRARQRYEELLLANPKTHLISVNRSEELNFARSISHKSPLINNHRVAQQAFSKAGPYNIGGRTRAAAFDIRDEQTIIAGGVSGNIWKSNDGGQNWNRTSTPNIRNSVTTLIQDTREGHEDVWYFGTGELLGNSANSPVSPYRGAGIYQSTDNGDSWSVLSATVDNATPDNFTSMFQYVWRMVLTPISTEQTILYAATFGGILKSEDNGATWSRSLGEALFNLEDAELNCELAPFYTEIHQTAAGILFAAMSTTTAPSRNGLCEDESIYANAGLYYSLDGSIWHNITPPFLPLQHDRTVINSNKDGSEIYFLTDGDQQTLLKYTIIQVNASTVEGRWRSLPSGIPRLGGTFGDFDTQGGYNMMVAVHPNDDQMVFVGGTNLYRSSDGFSSDHQISWIGGYSPENDASQYANHHADQHFVIFTPSNPNEMISGSDGGLIKTFNNQADSVTWTSLNNGYLTSQFYSIAQRKDARSNEIIGGMQDNGSWFRDAIGENPSWNRILGGDGGYAAITSNSDYRYASFQNSQIYRTTLTDNYRLRSFARVDPLGGGLDGESYLFINPFQLDPKNENKMFLLGGNVMWRNNNLAQIPGGSQFPTSMGWDKLSDSQLNNGIYSCLRVSSGADIVYGGITAAQPGIVIINKASDKLKTTVTFRRDSLTLPAGGHVSSIGINPENENHIVLTVSNYNVPSIFESFDGGISYNDISGNLEQYPDGRGNGPSVRWVEIVPTLEGYSYYVGTSIGLYSTNQPEGNLTVWEQNGADEIGHAVITMMDYRPIDGRLVVASHGGGTFEAILSNARKFSIEKNTPDQVKTSLYPTPFSRETTFSYDLPEGSEVIIELFDSSGRLVRNLLYAPQYAGSNQITWDGFNNAGIPVKPGIYQVVMYYQNKKYVERTIRLPQ